MMAKTSPPVYDSIKLLYPLLSVVFVTLTDETYKGPTGRLPVLNPGTCDTGFADKHALNCPNANFHKSKVETNEIPILHSVRYV